MSVKKMKVKSVIYKPSKCRIGVHFSAIAIAISFESDTCFYFTEKTLKRVTWKYVKCPEWKANQKGIFIVFHTKKYHDRASVITKINSTADIEYFTKMLEMKGVEVKEEKRVDPDDAGIFD